MEPVLLFLAEFWWLAPATVGAGAVGYGALTTNRRRARRLEVDAARYEANQAYSTLVAARAGVRAAQADLMTAQAHRTARTPDVPTVAQARRDLAGAKRDHRAAIAGVRAGRSRIRAARAQLAVAPGGPLPIARVVAAHDAVTARWLAYETDAGKALSFPQMLDARHPSTLAFLRAQRTAMSLRPAGAKAKVTPEQYVAYREAVRQADAALTAAERDAERATRAWLPRTAGEGPRVTASAHAADAAPERRAAPLADDAAPADAIATDATPQTPRAESARTVWPVPARSSSAASPR